MAEWTRDEIIRACREQGVCFLNLQFTDIVGLVKSITLPMSQIEHVLDEGVWFDGSSIQGFARVSESDMYLFPDMSTFAVIPWSAGSDRTARLICDVYTPDGEPFAGSPRTTLIRALQEAESMGFKYMVGPELEFFLFETDEKGLPIVTGLHDQAGYFDATSDRGMLVRQAMSGSLEVFDIEVLTGHHEGAPGQHEIDFRYQDALKAADSAVTFKYVLKAVAQQHGLYATFMPKPVEGINGSGMHVHQNLASTATGENLFADPSDDYGLSKLAKHFMAGQLYHARAMSVVLAPLVNSYKRLVPGYEAPVYVSWARINRSALIRIPRARSIRSTRLELRCPDPSCNPYLALAVMLHCGLDGIKHEMSLPDPSEEDLYEAEWARAGLETLPGSLKEAIDVAAENPVIQRALGPHIFERYLDAKNLEWDAYRVAVTDWELERYFRIY
jgi:glutamine synthetase